MTSDLRRTRHARPDKRTGMQKTFSALMIAAILALWCLASPAERMANVDLRWDTICVCMLGILPCSLLTIPTCSADSLNLINSSVDAVVRFPKLSSLLLWL